MLDVPALADTDSMAEGFLGEVLHSAEPLSPFQVPTPPSLTTSLVHKHNLGVCVPLLTPGEGGTKPLGHEDLGHKSTVPLPTPPPPPVRYTMDNHIDIQPSEVPG